MADKIELPLKKCEKNAFKKNYVPITYTDESQFAFVHKTNYMPSNNKIKSIFRAGGKYEHRGVINEIDFSFDVPIYDDTVHFSLNSEATEIKDEYGYNNRKYAVIIPGNVEEFKNISCFHSNNIEFDGVKDISKAYILCPLEEYEICKKNNPATIIIPYEGTIVDGFCELFLDKLGYNIEKLDLSNSGFEWYYNDPKRTKSIMDKYGFKFEPESVDMFFRKRFFQQIVNAKCFYSKLIEVAITNGINLFSILLDLNKINENNRIRISKREHYPIDCDLSNISLDEDLQKFLTNFLNNNNQLEVIIFINELLKVNINLIKQDFTKIKSEKKI